MRDSREHVAGDHVIVIGEVKALNLQETTAEFQRAILQPRRACRDLSVKVQP